MLSRRQLILLKRAQAEAGLDDADYRDALAVSSGMDDCRSSTDPRLTDEHMDVILAYFEAVYWYRADRLQPGCKHGAEVFRSRGFWADRNRRGNTSRDRYVNRSLKGEIAALERELNDMGFGLSYVRAIQNNIRPFALISYAAALRRTVSSKRKAVEHDHAA